jgi:aarF domain-containing kinase
MFPDYFLADFVQEARNSERAAKNFRNNKMVRIPHVFWV